MKPHATAKCELLSPAGSFDAACAAFAFGADAVYLGLRKLSARAEAVNFSPDELRSICAYAHALSPRRSIYVTLNTLVRDDELSAACESIHAVSEADADGAIVQDQAIAALARRVAPSLPLHASTQMFVHSAEGAAAARDMGYSRVVLARELSLDEIASITASCGIETEVFIHGALCYGYSGQCLFSALATGRSGNRGQCAYCCRSRFSDPSGTGKSAFPFSMRDLAIGKDVLRLRDAGVASLKIEGRMKSPLYVAAATRLYRLILDGTASENEIGEALADLQTVFSRPTTTLYFGGANRPEKIIDPETVGHRGFPIGKIEAITGDRSSRQIRLVPSRAIELHDGIQIDLPGRPYGFAVESLRLCQSGKSAVVAPPDAPVLVGLPRDAPRLPVGATVSCASSQAAKRRLAFPAPRAAELLQAFPVDVAVALARDAISASAQFCGQPASVSVPASLEAAQNRNKTAEAVNRAFSRMGDSRWRARSVSIDDPDGLFAPASLLNALRRSLCAALDKIASDVSTQRLSEGIASVAQWLDEPIGNDPRIPEGLSVKIRFDATPKAIDCAEIVLQLTRADCRDVAALDAHLDKWLAVAPRIRLALPLVVRNADIPVVENAVRLLVERGHADWEVGEISMLHLLRRIAGDAVSIVADASLYALNGAAARELHALGIGAAVIPAEADAEDAKQLCSKAPDFFIANVESRPPLFVSETKPLAPWAKGERFALEGPGGHRYETEHRDALWLTRMAEPLRVPAPHFARRTRREAIGR